MKRYRLFAIAGAVFLSACASGGSGPKAEVSESSRNKVTSVEIATVPATNAYDLVYRLRPHWLRAGATGSIGGGSINNQVTLVYLDGSKIGTIEALRSISASGIKTMEWLESSRASIVLSDIGNEPIAGAISIKTK
ncbi:MAG TPA: hypothetical protein VF042_09380 [Gemmatimonadaceae bacterium]